MNQDTMPRRILTTTSSNPHEMRFGLLSVMVMTANSSEYHIVASIERSGPVLRAHAQVAIGPSVPLVVAREEVSEVCLRLGGIVSKSAFLHAHYSGLLK